MHYFDGFLQRWALKALKTFFQNLNVERMGIDIVVTTVNGDEYTEYVIDFLGMNRYGDTRIGIMKKTEDGYKIEKVIYKDSNIEPQNS